MFAFRRFRWHHVLAALVFGQAIALAAAFPLHRTDFNGAHPWPAAAVETSGGATASAGLAAVGTVDTRGGTLRSGALRMQVSATGAAPDWIAAVSSGALPVVNVQPDLAQLTLAFSLSVSHPAGVLVRIESLSAAGVRTGGLETTVYPAASDFFQRFALELADFVAVGPGTFDPLAPQVRFTFALGAAFGWPAAAALELRVDNLHYGRASYYVSPQGHNGHDGLTPGTAFATIQRALDVAQPGATILVMAGTYEPTHSGGDLAQFPRAGLPDAWITLKAYPGHHPVLRGQGWNILKIGRGHSGNTTSAPALAYLEIRGLTLRGYADDIPVAARGTNQARSNTSGITIEGRYEVNPPHHVRVADCSISQVPGGGIAVIRADFLQFERNHVFETSWWCIYANSAVSVYQPVDFSGLTGDYRVLIADNRLHDNETYYPWIAQGRISDGNGIIIDDTKHTQLNSPFPPYRGRTLVQNNLSYLNGGSGMHAYQAERVDFVNNSVWGNSRSPALRYPSIGAVNSNDVRMVNNLLHARSDKPLTSHSGGPILYANNVFFGGDTAPPASSGGVTVIGSIIADPLYVAPAWGDFRLQPGSPARSTGALVPYAPRLDFFGTLRSWPTALDRGAIESTAAPDDGTLGTGLRGTYFANRDLAGPPAVERIEAVAFDWGAGSPHPGLPADNFSVRWEGELEVPVSGAYTFRTRTNDGVRFWFDQELLIDRWTDGIHTVVADPRPLLAGVRYSVRMEMYEGVGTAMAHLEWSGPGQANFAPVPATVLFPLTGWNAWRRDRFGADLGLPFAAPLADPDGDGLSNLLEYALDGDPFSPGTAAPVTTGIDSATGRLTLRFLRARSDLLYRVESSDDCSHWTTLVDNPGTVGEWVTVTDNVSLPVPARRFLRLRVSPAP